MALEASIVERLQELRRWQVEQQERLLQHQQEQRETLSREQVRMYQALGLTVQDNDVEETKTELSFQDSLEQDEASKADGETRRFENLLKTGLGDLGSPRHMSPQRRHELLHNSSPTLMKEETHVASRSNNRLFLPERILPADRSSADVENEPLDHRGANLPDKDVDLVSFNDPDDDFKPESFIEGVGPLPTNKPTRKSLIIDDIPVPSPRKDFNTLLEERLRDAQFTGDNKTVNVKPVKRPFLKKGQGLARFRLGAGDDGSKRQIRPRTMSLPSTVRMENGKGAKTGSDRANEAQKAGKGRVNKPEKSQKKLAPVPSRAQSRLSLKNVQPPVRIRSKSMCNPGESQTPVEDRLKLNDSFNNSDIESKTKRELEEVRIFELLEEKAENSSFCSTSSTVVALLQQSVQSTPLKNKNRISTLAQNWRNGKDDTNEDVLLAEIVYTTQSNSSTTYKKQFQNDLGDLRPETDAVLHENLGNGNICELPYGTDVDPDYGVDFPKENYTGEQNFDRQVNYEKNTSLHVRFSEYNEYKTLTDTSTISNDSEAPRHYSDQRAWSDCSVTTDSSDAEEFASIIEEHDNILSLEGQGTSKNKPKAIQPNRYRKEIKREDQSASDPEEKRYSYHEDASDSASEQDEKTENSVGENESSILADSTLVEEELGPVKKQQDNGLVFKSELLKTRLLELEGEIEIFRKENIAVTALKEKLQEERRALERSFKDKESRFEERKQKMESALQEEKKRLVREKSALENRLKDAQVKAQQNKQERLEVQRLREQVEELKEEMNQKESRWNAAQARHRSQVRILQTENSKLKQDLEKLQNTRKINAKARIHTKTVPASNTKAIHQINKQLEFQKQTQRHDSSSDEEAFSMQPMMEAMNLNEHENDFDRINSDGSRMIIYDRTQNGSRSKICTARKRDLYDNLLKDATMGLKEGEEATKKAVQTLESSKINERQMKESLDHAEANDESEETRDHRENLLSREANNPLEDYKKASDSKNSGKVDKQGIREVQHPDGRAEFWYPNGNVKKISADGTITKLIYYNGDVCESRKDGSVKYFYATTRTWHTTLSDGLEILEFPDGQVERRSKDGTVEVSFPDGTVRILQSNGTEKWALPDGTLAETSSDGEKILILPNGQREVHTKEHKRREYPDGTVKLVYPDGSQETRYAGGRVRLKDKDGNLLMDSHHQ